MWGCLVNVDLRMFYLNIVRMHLKKLKDMRMFHKWYFKNILSKLLLNFSKMLDVA